MKSTSHRILESVALIGLSLCPLLSAQEPAGSVSADGFVTQTTGRIVQIGTLSVQFSEKTRCSQYDVAFATWAHDQQVRQLSTQCAPLALSIGTYVHLVGTRKDDGSLEAAELDVNDPWRVVEAVRPPKLNGLRLTNFISGGPLRGQFRGGSFLEEFPIVVQTKEGIVAHFWVNGYPLELTKASDMRLAPTSLDRRTMFQFAANDLGAHVILRKQPKYVPLVFPATDKLLPGVYLAYRGTQATNGDMVATSLGIFPNVPITPETESLDSPAPQIVEPNYETRSSGTIRYKDGDPIEIVPDRGIQEYVQKAGVELIPAYQKALIQSDPTKIKFRFYVVHPFINHRKNEFVQIDGAKTLPVNWRGSNWKGLDSPFVLPTDNSQVDRFVEMPDGVILIPDVALARLRNKAQLAFALSVAVQSIVQREEDIAVGAMHYVSGEFAMPPSGISYMETMPTLRMSIRQMYLAGYDIREAPFAWKYERGEQVSNPVINSPHPDQEFPWYAAYAFHYISQYYSDVDYSKLKKGEAEYAQFLDELHEADPEAFEKK